MVDFWLHTLSRVEEALWECSPLNFSLIKMMQSCVTSNSFIFNISIRKYLMETNCWHSFWWQCAHRSIVKHRIQKNWNGKKHGVWGKNNTEPGKNESWFRRALYLMKIIRNRNCDQDIFGAGHLTTCHCSRVDKLSWCDTDSKLPIETMVWISLVQCLATYQSTHILIFNKLILVDLST